MDLLIVKELLDKLTPNLPYFEYHYELNEISQKSDNPDGKKFLDLLVNISSTQMEIENRANPYELSLETEELNSLKSTSNIFENPEMKYLIHDLLWIHDKKNVLYGIQALKASLESAKKMDPTQYHVDILNRLKRSLIIAHQVKNRVKENILEHTLETIIQIFNSAITTDSYLCGLIVELFIECNAKKYIEIIIESECLTSAANTAELNNDWQLAHQLKKSILLIYRFLKDDFKINSSLVELSRSYSKQGSQLKHGIPAKLCFQSAIKYVLEISGKDFHQIKKELKDEFHMKLLEAQSVIPEQMHLCQTESISIEDQCIMFEKELGQGKNIFECLVIFILKFPQHDESFFDPMVKNCRNGLIHSLFCEQSIVDKKGRTISTLSDNQKINTHDLNTHLSMYWDYSARLIEAGRYWMNSEYSLIKSSWNYFINDFGAIRPGHEQIVIEGLHFGFIGNYLVASHLLIPQIEDSLRYLLECKGVLCSKISLSLNQKDEVLEELLEHPELIEILGKEFVFEISKLLLNPGLNFRNNGSHGKLTYEECWSQYSIYTWYLALRLYSLGPSILKQGFIARPTQ